MNKMEITQGHFFSEDQVICALINDAFIAFWDLETLFLLSCFIVLKPHEQIRKEMDKQKRLREQRMKEMKLNDYFMMHFISMRKKKSSKHNYWSILKVMLKELI